MLLIHSVMVETTPVVDKKVEKINPAPSSRKIMADTLALSIKENFMRSQVRLPRMNTKKSEPTTPTAAASSGVEKPV